MPLSRKSDSLYCFCNIHWRDEHLNSAPNEYMKEKGIKKEYRETIPE